MNVLYRLLRFLTRKTLQIYFKKISFSGKNRLETDGPRIIAVNHPASFLDACLLACFLPGPLYFLVRGDVFHPWFRAFFRWTYQIPIYRFRDGFGNLRRNARTFMEVHEVLASGKTVVIFAEGLTEYEKKLRPIQRGAARMAVGFQNAYPRVPIKIQVMGINYENLYQFRSHVHIHICKGFVPGMGESDKDTLQTITQEIQHRLAKVVIHLDDPVREAAFDQLAKEEGLFFRPAAEALSTQLVLAERLNKMEASELPLLYRKHSQLQKGQRVLPNPSGQSPSLSAWYRFLYFIFFPIFYVPAWAARNLSQRYFLHPSFQQPIAIGMAMFFYLFWILLFTLVLLLNVDSIWVSLAFLILFVFLGRYLAVSVWLKSRKI